MKKNQFSYFMVMLMLTFFFFSCNKSEMIFTPESSLNVENDDQKQNEATWISTDDAKFKWLMKLKIFVGHTVDQCGNACIKIFGKYGHIDCVGVGHVCNHKVDVRLSICENYTEHYTLTLIDPDGLGEFLEFPFPDRSLFITNPVTNTELWLNIPEQLLVRRNLGDSMVIHNAWFSERPELENR